MITSSDLFLIHAFLPAQSTITRQIAARDLTTVLAPASQVCTASLQRRSVRMPTAMVRRTVPFPPIISISKFLGFPDPPLISTYVLDY